MVLDSRVHELGRRRRRRCLNCGHRWSTIEIPLRQAVLLMKAHALLQSAGMLAQLAYSTPRTHEDPIDEMLEQSADETGS